MSRAQVGPEAIAGRGWAASNLDGLQAAMALGAAEKKEETAQVAISPLRTFDE